MQCLQVVKQNHVGYNIPLTLFCYCRPIVYLILLLVNKTS